MDLKSGNEYSIFSIPELNLSAQITYVCGLCGTEDTKKPTDDIICHNCSSRILYKKRRPDGIQIQAR